MKKAKTKKDMVTKSNIKPSQKKQGKQKPVRNVRKKAPEKKGGSNPTILERIDMAKQFLRESKMELKKVKWPTKKRTVCCHSGRDIFKSVNGGLFWYC